MNLFITNAKVWQNGNLLKANLEINDDKIIGIYPPHADYSPADDVEIIDASDAILMPGLCDIHVHFRQPGQEYKETINSGCRAAAAGGFTTVCTMPNLSPAPDSLQNLKVQLDTIKSDACIEVLPYATITKQRLGKEIIDYEALTPFVAGFSDDGSGVQNDDVMKLAMQKIAPTGRPLAAHCEVNSLLDGGYIHKGSYAMSHNHKGICSQSEWEEVERDIKLSEATGCPLHICHISTKESVQLVREAKARGARVTCETAPHYLAFTQDDLQENGRWKMNPPLRDVADRDALLQGIADGTIDAIATDHAPHSLEEKSKGLQNSAMGVVGLETAIAAVYTYAVIPGNISLPRLIQLLCDNPRRIIGRHAEIAPGQPANLTLFHPEKKWIVDPGKFKSMGRATPFDGVELQGKIMLTIFNGKILHKATD